MKTSSKILFFGFVGCIILFLVAALVVGLDPEFRNNSTLQPQPLNGKNALVYKIPLSGHLHLTITDHRANKVKKEPLTYQNPNNKKQKVNPQAVTSFHQISISGKFNVVIKKSDKQKVTVTADKRLRPYLTVANDHGILSIKLANKTNNKNTMVFNPVKVLIDTRAPINKISLTGTNTLNISDINTNQFSLDIAGTLPKVILSGTVKNLAINAAGKFNVNAKTLKADNATIAMAGNGNISTFVNKKLSVESFGKGVVQYYGNPEQVSHNALGNLVMMDMSKPEKKQ